MACQNVEPDLDLASVLAQCAVIPVWVAPAVVPVADSTLKPKAVAYIPGRPFVLGPPAVATGAAEPVAAATLQPPLTRTNPHLLLPGEGTRAMVNGLTLLLTLHI